MQRMNDQDKRTEDEVFMVAAKRNVFEGPVERVASRKNEI